MSASPATLAAYIAVLAVTTLFWGGSTALFWAKRNVDLIQKRTVWLVVLNSAISYSFTIPAILALDPFQAYVSFPCWLHLYLLYIPGPLCIYCVFIRALNLVYVHCVNQSRLNEHDPSLLARMTLVERLTFRLFAAVQRGPGQPGSPQQGRPPQASVSANGTPIGTTTPGPVSGSHSGAAIPERQAAQYNGVVPQRVLARSVTVLVVVEHLLYCLPFLMYRDGEMGQPVCPGAAVLPAYVLILLFLVCAPVVMHSIRRISDTLFLRKELSWSLGVTLTLYLLYLVAAFVAPDSPLRTAWGPATYLCLVGLATQAISVVAPVGHLWRYGGSKLKFDQASFVRVLDDRAHFALLKDMMAAEFSLENGLFHEEYSDALLDLRRATEALALVGTPGGAEKHARAQTRLVRQLYDKFIRHGATHELNLPGKLRQAITAAVRDGACTLERLSPVHKEVLNMIYVNTFPRFVSKYGVHSDPSRV